MAVTTLHKGKQGTLWQIGVMKTTYYDVNFPKIPEPSGNQTKAAQKWNYFKTADITTEQSKEISITKQKLKWQS